MRTPAPIRTILLATLVLLTGCAGSPPAPTERNQARPAPSGNADEVAAIALRSLVVIRDIQGALAASARASELAPDRPELAWLHARACMEVRGCEPEPIEAKLRKLDADNGVVWLGPLARAQARRDNRAEDQILDAMSRATRFDLYWTSLVWRLSAARAAGAPQPAEGVPPRGAPLTAALDSTTESLSRLAIPAFKPLSASCSQQRVQDAATAARCEKISRAMQRSDTTLVEGLGLGIAQRLSVPGTPAAVVLEERIETLSYRSHAAGAVVSSQVERDKFSAQMLELMKKLPREQDVSLAILRWSGQPLLPAK
jgi:hypothetical protein